MLEKILNIAIESAQIASKYISSQAGDIKDDMVEEKAQNDFVTFVDKNSEKLIIENILRNFPDHGILAEESGSRGKGSGYSWIIDPLDGTKNFIKGIPAYAVSIGVTLNKEVIAGVVADIPGGNIFHAAKGKGAFKNNKAIKVSKQKNMDGSFFATGFPFRNKELIPSYFRVLEKLMDSASGARRIGAAALDICWLAQGSFDFFFEKGLSPWDVAAGAVILSEAGGTITDFKGESNYLFGREVIASNGNFHNELIEMIPRYF